MPYIAFDSHTHYTLARVEDAAGHCTAEARIAHERGALKEFLTRGAARVTRSWLFVAFGDMV